MHNHSLTLAWLALFGVLLLYQCIDSLLYYEFTTYTNDLQKRLPSQLPILFTRTAAAAASSATPENSHICSQCSSVAGDSFNNFHPCKNCSAAQVTHFDHIFQQFHEKALHHVYADLCSSQSTWSYFKRLWVCSNPEVLKDWLALRYRHGGTLNLPPQTQTALAAAASGDTGSGFGFAKLLEYARILLFPIACAYSGANWIMWTCKFVFYIALRTTLSSNAYARLTSAPPVLFYDPNQSPDSPVYINKEPPHHHYNQSVMLKGGGAYQRRYGQGIGTALTSSSSSSVAPSMYNQ